MAYFKQAPLFNNYAEVNESIASHFLFRKLQENVSLLLLKRSDEIMAHISVPKIWQTP